MLRTNPERDYQTFPSWFLRLASKECRPERENQSQAFNKCQPYNKHQEYCSSQCNLPVELMAGQATDHDQQEDRDVYPEGSKHAAAQYNRTNNDEEDLPVKLADFFFYGFG